MPITNFKAISYKGQKYKLHHLQPLKAKYKLDDDNHLTVRFKFSTHVFSQKAPLGTTEDTEGTLKDSGGRLQLLCTERYNLSLNLPTLCQTIIDDDCITWISQDKNTVNNLAVINHPLFPAPQNGEHYLIVYQAYPSDAAGVDIEVLVKSAYTKNVNFSHIKVRKKISNILKSVHFQKKKMP